MKTALVATLVVIAAIAVIVQVVALVAWRIESQKKDITSALQRCVIRANKFCAQLDRRLGTVLRQCFRYSELYGWIVVQRVFTLFFWGVALAALAALGRETDDWHLRVTSSTLFALYGLACGESVGAVQKHFLSEAKAQIGNRPSIAVLIRILGFLTSILGLLWMATVFSKMIPKAAV